MKMCVQWTTFNNMEQEKNMVKILTAEFTKFHVAKSYELKWNGL